MKENEILPSGASYNGILTVKSAHLHAVDGEAGCGRGLSGGHDGICVWRED